MDLITDNEVGIFSKNSLSNDIRLLVIENGKDAVEDNSLMELQALIKKEFGYCPPKCLLVFLVNETDLFYTL